MDTLEHISPVKPGLIATDADTPGLIENRTFDELAVGDAAQIVRTVTLSDIELFANVSGDVNPAHLDRGYAEGTMFHGVIAHGMLGGSLFSTVLGTLLPGPGTIYLGQDLRFRRPVKPGDTLTAKVTVREKHPDKNRVVLDCQCTNQNGADVISGTADVIAPTEKVSRHRIALPEVSIARHEAYADLLRRAAGLPPLTTAIVHPCDPDSLRGALAAATEGFIDPILVGPRMKIRAVATAAGLDLAAIPIVDAAHSHDAAEIAVALARDGKVKALMKGSLHTDELMHEAMRRESGLAHRAAHQSCLCHAAGVVTPAADPLRLRHQHRARPRGQGRHRAERDRPRDRPWHRRARRLPCCRRSRP